MLQKGGDLYIFYINYCDSYDYAFFEDIIRDLKIQEKFGFRQSSEYSITKIVTLILLKLLRGKARSPPIVKNI